MKCKYTSQWLSKYGIVSSPRVTAVLTNRTTGMSLPVFSLIDSGSTPTLVNPEIGKALGIDIESGEVVSLGGIGGNVVGYKHPLTLRLAGDTHEYTVECTFAPTGFVDALLGQVGFFDHYKVIFEGYKNQFEVIAQRSRPRR